MGQVDAVIFLRTDLKMCAEVNYTEAKSSSSIGYQLLFSSTCERAQQWGIISSYLDMVLGCSLVIGYSKGNVREHASLGHATRCKELIIITITVPYSLLKVL